MLILQYIPVQDEKVLGVVTKATGRMYRVDIGSAVSAVLPELAFEGATKRNKPNIQVGVSQHTPMHTHTHTHTHTGRGGGVCTSDQGPQRQ